MISDHSTAPRPSGESTFQGNLFTPATSVLELRQVSCAYETGRPAVQEISFAAKEGEILRDAEKQRYCGQSLGLNRFVPANCSYLANSYRHRT